MLRAWNVTAQLVQTPYICPRPCTPALDAVFTTQVSEAELEAIARGGGLPEVEEGEGGSEATRRLLGDYETPQRCAVNRSCC